ncbi:hypothetical protein H5398_08410 [Tessaracoccus sp. MC1679]|uniref:hypothetical protein n=1 Tax=Tessaracoccus sp. MC1679 TaxID=2760313 RepID=UPI0016036B19|nr:hypothetical protein [Tessaracoccus sp. MC1679]MBB1515987.1 hypothetical protein [Tessaracoccus sp. MC1679]
MLVLERPIDGAQSVRWEQSLADLTPTNRIRLGAEGLLGPLADGHMSVTSLLKQTAIVVLPWGQIDSETLARLASASGLMSGAAEPLLHTLRQAVSHCTSNNASRSFAERQALNRQSIQLLITRTTLLIDQGALTSAVSSGGCVPVDFDTSIEDPRFFEGIDVRPGHVVAGLPAPRIELVEFASDALRRQHVVLLTGPSGVGKSTVMWSTAYAMRDVIWYEVTRLECSDVEAVLRLLVSLGPKPSSPVGLVVDSVGTKDPAAWDALCDRLPADGSVLMIGSVRTEDLSLIAGARSSAVVECRMDELVARELFEALREQGRTSLHAWEDAYEASGNLTMEYTYLLTQGQRLSAVLGEQVRRREGGNRSIELEVLRLVTTAARWGARVPAHALAAIAPDAAPRRAALRRLIGEHLITHDGAHYGGLHQLRASVLSSAVHETPPPSLEATAADLVRVVDPTDLRTFVLECLLEQPGAASTVIGALRERVQTDPDFALLTIALRTLRAADFRRDGTSWANILDAHVVAQAYRPVTVWLALTDSDTEVPEHLWKPGIAASIREMKAAPQQPRWRDEFIAGVGAETLLAFADAAPTLTEIEALVAALQGASAAPELARAISQLPTVVSFVADAAPEAASKFMGLLGTIDPRAAQSMRETLGSDQWARSILLSLNPWIVQTERHYSDDGDLELSAALLHGGDWFGVDPHEQAVQAARTLLNLYPECTVNVRTINATGDLLTQENHEPGRSQLLRRYNQHPREISWNRERARLALQLALRRSDVERAQAVTRLVPEVDRFLSELTSAWARKAVNRASIRDFAETQKRIIEANDALPAHASPDIAEPVYDEPSKSDPNVFDNDDFHALVDGICSNIATRLLEGEDYNALAAYVGDTILKLVTKARSAENWQDSSDVDPQVALENIERTLHHLHAVLADIAFGHEPKDIVLGVASLGGRTSALSRCAERSIKRATDRLREHLDQVASEAATLGLSVRWVHRDTAAPSAVDWPPIEVALIVDVQVVDDWGAAASTMHALLATKGSTIDLGHPILVPAVHGFVVPALGIQSWSCLYPAAHAALAWGTGLGILIGTPTADALQRLWSVLQAMSTLTLRARLREMPHTFEDLPPELAAQLAHEVGLVGAALTGSSLGQDWEVWRAETVDIVLSETRQPTNSVRDVWVARATSSADSVSLPRAQFQLLWEAVLTYDLEHCPNAVV